MRRAIPSQEFSRPLQVLFACRKVEKNKKQPDVGLHTLVTAHDSESGSLLHRPKSQTFVHRMHLHFVCDVDLMIQRWLSSFSLVSRFIIEHHRRVGIYLTKSLFYVKHVLSSRMMMMAL